jgi:hypothetical protein
MVCDLQGVLDMTSTPPKFELTDPCIHYASRRGRKMVFGRADRGKKGMHEFFKTHNCNAVCRLLELEEFAPRRTKGTKRRRIATMGVNAMHGLSRCAPRASGGTGGDAGRL